MEIGISWENAPGYKQGKHKHVANSGCLRVSQILVNKASGDSVLQVLGNNARKNCQIVPLLPMHMAPLSRESIRRCANLRLQNPKYGCRGTVTARFALIAVVAWKRLADSTLGKLFVHPEYG